MSLLSALARPHRQSFADRLDALAAVDAVDLLPPDPPEDYAPDIRTGPDMLAALWERGVEASKVERQRSGMFIVTFRDPDLQNINSFGTNPAWAWAECIEIALPNYEVVQTYDCVAEHRPHQPVLWSTVMLREKRESASVISRSRR